MIKTASGALYLNADPKQQVDSFTSTSGTKRLFLEKSSFMYRSTSILSLCCLISLRNVLYEFTCAENNTSLCSLAHAGTALQF